MMDNLKDKLEACGRYWARGLVPNDQLERFKGLLIGQDSRGERIRNDSVLWTELLRSNFHQAIVASIPNIRLVRAVGFYKSSVTRWSLPWHQDRVIAVQEKHDCQGFKNWSRKEGQWHCEAPLSILKNMFFCRIYIDDSHENNGSMEIAVGSHKNGCVVGEDVDNVAALHAQEICEAKAGDVLILPMLTLHRSKRALQPKTRRVIRLDYADVDLPAPLDWAFSE